MMAIDNKYGAKMEHDPQWSGPLSVKRRATDVRFLKAFVMMFFIWLIPAALASLLRIIDFFQDSAHQFSSEAFGFLVVSAVISLFLSIMYIILLRWFAKFVAYFAIVAFLGIMLKLILSVLFHYLLYKSGYAMLYFLVLVVVFVLCFLLVIKCRQKINMACQVIKEASACVMFFPTSFIFPFLPIIATIVVASSSYCVYEIYDDWSFELSQSSKERQPMHNVLVVAQFFNLFGFLWIQSFIIGWSQMIMSGTFSTWYWSLDKTLVPSLTIFRFVKITAVYHLGTVAFGSFVITVCRLMRMLLRIKDKSDESHNCFCLCCAGWMRNLQDILKCVNRTAFVMSASHGTDFIRSAKDGFKLVFRNLLKCAVANWVTEAIIGVGIALEVGLMYLVIMFALPDMQFNARDEYVYVGAVVLALVIVSFFFQLLQTAVDTIYLCVLEDYERNDGSAVQPYYMTRKLKRLFVDQ